jgi:hypothetical protein
MFSIRTLQKRLRRAAVIFTTAWFLFGGLLHTPLHAETPIDQPMVLIEEIAWAGSSLSTADEWIELANMGTATATIAGWSIRGIAPLPVFLPEGAEIVPGGTYRIANYPETDAKSSLAVTVQLTTTTISLSNSVLDATLIDASGAIVDRAGNGSAPFAGTASPRATMIRATSSTGDVAPAWITATSSVGFKTTGVDFGAPGVCLFCVPVAVMPEDVSTPVPAIVPEPEISVAQAVDMLLETDETTQGVISAEELASSTTQIVPEIRTTTSTTGDIATPPSPLTLRINEIVSNPATGPEWIELEMWDASRRIANIPAHTPVNSPGYLVVTLASARLNNGGDSVSIRESSGVVLHAVTIPALEHGVAWAKNTSGTWQETHTLTPNGINRFFIAEQTPKTQATNMPSVIPSVAAATTTSVAANTLNATTSPAIPSAPPMAFRLNEVVSNPQTGSEWVELFTTSTSATSTDRALELWDASGRIALISAFTPLTSPGYLTVKLASARLNNGGDELSLRTAANGLTEDTVTIPPLARGISWARDESGAWTDTDHLTPGALNILSSEPTAPDRSSNTDNAETRSLSSSSKVSKTSSSLLSYTNTMPTEPLSSTRVRLVGTVGSVPRLFGATHAFILLGEDGRAAIAYLPKHLNTPRFGSTVRVMGTLTATERQMELRMKTSDVWMTVPTSTPPQPRVMDFLAPATDDAWSLVNVTGTVTNVGTSRILLDVDAVEVTVTIPPVSGYRAKRLNVGDTVRVTGLFDPRKEAPTLMIRVPEDVFLVSHAPQSVTAPEKPAQSTFPDWSPFGAAAGAVAMTGGVQRLRSYMKRRKLAAMAG